MQAALWLRSPYSSIALPNVEVVNLPGGTCMEKLARRLNTLQNNLIIYLYLKYNIKHNIYPPVICFILLSHTLRCDSRTSQNQTKSVNLVTFDGVGMGISYLSWLFRQMWFMLLIDWNYYNVLLFAYTILWQICSEMIFQFSSSSACEKEEGKKEKEKGLSVDWHMCSKWIP